MDLVKGFTDFQRRAAKQQKRATAAVCRFCTWGITDVTAASYLQHLKDAHGDALNKTNLGDESNDVTLREIDDALNDTAEETTYVLR
jgi:hypothetical protein